MVLVAQFRATTVGGTWQEEKAQRAVAASYRSREALITPRYLTMRCWPELTQLRTLDQPSHWPSNNCSEFTEGHELDRKTETERDDRTQVVSGGGEEIVGQVLLA